MNFRPPGPQNAFATQLRVTRPKTAQQRRRLAPRHAPYGGVKGGAAPARETPTPRKGDPQRPPQAVKAEPENNIATKTRLKCVAHNMTKNTKNINNANNVKMYFVKHMSFLKVSGQTASIAEFSVFFYIFQDGSKLLVVSFCKNIFV